MSVPRCQWYLQSLLTLLAARALNTLGMAIAVPSQGILDGINAHGMSFAQII